MKKLKVIAALLLLLTFLSSSSKSYAQTEWDFTGYAYLGQATIQGSNDCSFNIQVYFGFDNMQYIVVQKAIVPNNPNTVLIVDGSITPGYSSVSISGLTVYYYSGDGNGSFTIPDGFYTIQ